MLDIQRAARDRRKYVITPNKYGTGIFSTTVEQTVFTSVFDMDLLRLP
jgi:hypothetical protein